MQKVEIYVQRHMASCVLSGSKHFQYLKITCPCRGQKCFRSQHFSLKHFHTVIASLRSNPEKTVKQWIASSLAMTKDESAMTKQKNQLFSYSTTHNS